MKITLSLEELIYAFYSEGLFEQGNALKATYFQELSDEQMDLLLQVTCRSLLAKDYLAYSNHKFMLKPEVAAMIGVLHHADHSLQASKFREGGGQETLSVHLAQSGTYAHFLRYEGQVHVVERLEEGEAAERLGSFFDLPELPSAGESVTKLTQVQLETLLSLIDGQPEELAEYASNLPGAEKQKEKFLQALTASKGRMNTLIGFEFDANNEPIVAEMLMMLGDSSASWMVAKTDEQFFVQTCSKEALVHKLSKTIPSFAHKQGGKVNA
ncbi:hypothetical protein FHS18_003061 [Paenibacillus phyllosphaerae]|uniref:EspG family protein n=1 Tax=Paenibacillus phyllosphaerae TaxID=274593 RepID=A0A7W5AYC3_9BACL|nr:hypothetical protein [Paenibacillus phyllosphaerae]MBB3110993.1 hypothetical protein [Paenibacillus phyllosphaerae]